MSQAADVDVYKDGPIGRIVLQRTDKRNALTSGMVTAISDGLRALEGDDEIGVITLSGEGPSFCSGGDLRERGPDAVGFGQVWQMLAGGVDLVESIEQNSKVVIARVHGHVHAGGLLLSLCADLTVAAITARFRCPELLRGRPDPFIPLRLVEKIGRERAADLMYTAREIDGIEAQRIGLVARCVAEDELDAELQRVIAAVLETDPPSRTAWKRMLRAHRSTANAWEFTSHFTSEETAKRSYGFQS